MLYICIIVIHEGILIFFSETRIFYGKKGRDGEGNIMEILGTNISFTVTMILLTKASLSLPGIEQGPLCNKAVHKPTEIKEVYLSSSYA